MLNKKVMMLAIFLVSLMAISVVSATDNVISDIVSVENNCTDDVVCVEDSLDDVSSVENKDNQVILEEDELNETLSAVNDNDLESNSNDEVLTEYISYAQITTYTITGKAGDYVTLKAIVTNDQGIAKKATVEFRLNGQTYTTTTDSYGVASVTVKCPSTEVWDTSSKTKSNILTKSTYYKKYYVCDVTVYGTDYYKSTDSFHVISKKSPVVKKYKITKKKIIKTIKVKKGVKYYKWGNYVAATYKYKKGHFTFIETGMGKKNKGYITFFTKYHYKINGKWKWSNWSKISKGYCDEIYYNSLVKINKMKIKYTRVSYKRI